MGEAEGEAVREVEGEGEAVGEAEVNQYDLRELFIYLKKSVYYVG